jgi:NADH:ubiquinone oxidoreductase subunit 4 (subunit M)
MRRLIRWVALVGSLIPLALSLVLWFQFQPAQPGFQFQEQYLWYEAIGSSYHLGVDGLSITMVLLTTLLTPLCILASFNIKERVRSFMGLIPDAGNGDAGCVSFPGLAALLRLLGDRPGSDVLPDQSMG